MSTPSGAKAQALIDRDGSGVVGSYVEEGRLAPLADAAHHLGHERGGVASAEMVGMSAYRADFRETGNFQAFSGHCDQLSVIVDSHVIA